MTSKNRAYLMGLAHNIDTIFHIGKNSLTPEITEAINDALTKRELIKLNVLKNCMDDPKSIGYVLAERTNSELVQVIGRKIVLYRQNKNNPKIEFPR